MEVTSISIAGLRYVRITMAVCLFTRIRATPGILTMLVREPVFCRWRVAFVDEILACG